MLWKDICSNKLLGNAIIILFFNKVRSQFRHQS
jgi:hypothetical protein